MIGIFRSTPVETASAHGTAPLSQGSSQKPETQQDMQEAVTVQDTYKESQENGTTPATGFRAKYNNFKSAIRHHFSSRETVMRVVKGSVLGSLGAGLVIGSLGLPGIVGMGVAGAAFGFAVGAAKSSGALVQWAKNKFIEKDAKQAMMNADQLLTGSLRTGLKEALYGGTKGTLIGALACVAACSPLTAAVMGAAAGAGVSCLF